MKDKPQEFVKVSVSYLEALLEAKESTLKNIAADTFIDNLQRAAVMLDIAKLEGTINYAKTIIKEGERVG